MRNWRNLSYRVYGFEVRCARAISEGLVSGKGKAPILRSIKRELASFSHRLGLNNSDVSQLWAGIVGMYSSISKKVWGKRTDAVSVYQAVRTVLPEMERVKNEIALRFQIGEREADLDEMMSEGVFYLCSEHSGCAEGHRDWQGRMYVSTAWRDRVSDPEMRKKVAAYIRNHKCRTIEWVCSDPVYMVSRPNCGHRFVRVPVEEVLGTGVKTLIKRYDMADMHAYDSYAVSQYRKYYERLKMLLALKESCACEELDRDIRRTRDLVRKWNVK